MDGIKRLIRPIYFFSIILLVHIGGCGDNDAQSPSRGESVTGTFLEPIPLSLGGGFEAIDEECGYTDDPLYMNRFISTMFRDAVAIDDMLYLVDGSFLWTLDVSNLNHPNRTSLLRLPGVPISISAQDNHTLWIAAGNAGLLQVDIQEPQTPTFVNEVKVNGNMMDVEFQDNLLYTVSGYGGFHIFQVDDAGNSLTSLSQIAVSDFPNGLEVVDGIAFIAACGSLIEIDVAIPAAPRIIGRFPIETGHAKDVHIHQQHAYVSAGEALYAFDIKSPGAILSKGYYTDTSAEGFYVNGVTALNSTIFIAAGDESVRAVNISALTTQSGTPAAQTGPDEIEPVLNGPFEFDTVQVNSGFTNTQIQQGDPINVAMNGNALFVLGNFRWEGERLVRIFDIQQDGTLLSIGEYKQPQEAPFLRANENKMLIQQAAGTLEFISTVASAESAESVESVEYKTNIQFPINIIQAVFDDFSAYVATENGKIYQIFEDGMISQVSHILGATNIGVLSNGKLVFTDATENCIRIQNDSLSYTNIACEDTGFWGHSRIHVKDDLIVAYDPILGELLRYSTSSPATSTQKFIGLCENYHIDDFYSSAKQSQAMIWSNSSQIDLLCPSNHQEVATIMEFENSEALTLVKETRLPPGMYRSLVRYNNNLLALRTNNNQYTFTVVRIDESGRRFETTMDGFATQMAVQGSLLLIGDNDGGLRRFDIPASGKVTQWIAAPATPEEVSL